MGYTTSFSGQFDLNRPLDDKTYELLVGLADTRRVEQGFRKEQGYGIDGEFWYGKGEDEGITLNCNTPPRTQPGLWLQWEPTVDRLHIKWNEVEKFYCYIEWLVYIVTKILEPAGYKLTGTVDWQGEDDDDIGIISVDENGIIKSQKACDAPKWKVWTADDISVKPQVCLRCRVQREQDPDCQGCKALAQKRVMLDDYYYGRSDTIDVDLWRHNERKFYL